MVRMNSGSFKDLSDVFGLHINFEALSFHALEHLSAIETTRIVSIISTTEVCDSGLKLGSEVRADLGVDSEVSSDGSHSFSGSNLAIIVCINSVEDGSPDCSVISGDLVDSPLLGSLPDFGALVLSASSQFSNSEATSITIGVVLTTGIIKRLDHPGVLISISIDVEFVQQGISELVGSKLAIVVHISLIHDHLSHVAPVLG